MVAGRRGVGYKFLPRLSVKAATQGQLSKKLSVRSMPSTLNYPPFVVKFRVRWHTTKSTANPLSLKYRLADFLNARQFSIAELQPGSSISKSYCSFGKIQLRGLKIFWPAVAYEQDQFGASFWGYFPKGMIKDGQTHQKLVNYLTPTEVATIFPHWMSMWWGDLSIASNGALPIVSRVLRGCCSDSSFWYLYGSQLHCSGPAV